MSGGDLPVVIDDSSDVADFGVDVVVLGVHPSVVVVVGDVGAEQVHFFILGITEGDYLIGGVLGLPFGRSGAALEVAQVRAADRGAHRGGASSFLWAGVP